MYRSSLGQRKTFQAEGKAFAKDSAVLAQYLVREEWFCVLRGCWGVGEAGGLV
jgi:hypothetical protein